MIETYRAYMESRAQVRKQLTYALGLALLKSFHAWYILYRCYLGYGFG